jgi:hypothetical protein
LTMTLPLTFLILNPDLILPASYWCYEMHGATWMYQHCN